MNTSRLKIDKFMGIENADIELSDLNIFIGPQASGKSIIAKLVSFFEGIPSKHFMTGIYSGNNKRELDVNIKQEFEEIFPKYAWSGKAFVISYFNGEFEILLEGVLHGKNNSATQIKIDFPSDVKSSYSYLRRQIEQSFSIDDNDDFNFNMKKRDVFEEKVVPFFYKKEMKCFFRQQYFIPASRSYFANLQSSLFSVLASNLDIDPFLKEFGSLYENSKFIYSRRSMSKGRYKERQDRILKITEKTVKGRYEKKDGKDWIVDANKKTNLSNSSSGQQEALPMMMVLSTLPFLGFSTSRFMMRKINGDRQKLLVVEEPEAHLFPSAQKDIVDALSILSSMPDNQVIATTHSPYVLSAINNLIQAGEVISLNEQKLDKITSMVYPGEPLNINMVRAYSVCDGKVEDIVDREEGLIGQSIIDQVSEDFSSLFADLLEEI